MIAILGSTGCGKTSLVNLVPRFYDATNGDVLVDGVNVKDYDVDTLRSKIGVVLQKSELFSGTVAENIRWGCETATDEEVKTAAKIAQTQRMAIARAIIKKPEILIFDDSTSALDLSTEAKLHKALRENLSGVTVIMIAQRIASVMRADKIAVLENGSICAFGTHKELMESSSVYRDIYYSQMKQGEEEAVNG